MKKILFLRMAILVMTTWSFFACQSGRKPQTVFDLQFDSLDHYLAEFHHIRSIRSSDVTVVVVRSSQCDCVEPSMAIAVEAGKKNAHIVLVGSFKKDFAQYQEQLAVIPEHLVHYDLTGGFNAYGLDVLPSTFIACSQNGSIQFSSALDHSTKSEVSAHLESVH